MSMLMQGLACGALVSLTPCLAMVLLLHVQGASNNQCGANASCKVIQGIGICTYDAAAPSASTLLIAAAHVSLPQEPAQKVKEVEATLDLEAAVVADGSHYEDPNTGSGCEAGELAIRVTGLAGDM